MLIRRLDLTQGLTDDVTARYRAAQEGFLEGAPSEEAARRWFDVDVADGTRTWVVDPEPGSLLDTPVATLSAVHATANAGAGPVPAALLTDAVVRPTHKRRGLLRRLMQTVLADAADAGCLLASLTASDGGIYHRFGFGVATHRATVEVDTARFALRTPPTGRVELVDLGLAEVRRTRQDLFARFHATRRGSHERRGFYDPWLAAEWDFETNAPDPRLQAAFHRDDAGTVDGAVGFKGTWGERLTVVDLVTLNPEAELALWRFLADIEGPTGLTVRPYGLGGPLEWALVNPRCLRVTDVKDALWVRLLDVPTALTRRGWDRDGQTTIQVVDPMAVAGGTWRVTVRDGRADVEPADGAAAVTLGLDTLGTLYLGEAVGPALAAAGRLTGEPADVGDLVRLFAVDEPPLNLSYF